MKMAIFLPFVGQYRYHHRHITAFGFSHSSSSSSSSEQLQRSVHSSPALRHWQRFVKHRSFAHLPRWQIELFDSFNCDLWLVQLADELLNPIKGSFVGFSSLPSLAKDPRIDLLASSNSFQQVGFAFFLRNYPCYQPLLRHGMLVVRLSWLIQVLLPLIATWLFSELLLIQSQNFYLDASLDSVR